MKKIFSDLKNIIFGLMFLILIGTVFYLMIGQLKRQENYVIINKNLKITVELAQNDLGRYKGLSNRKSLCQNCGMLFSWPDPEVQYFVMRDMKFPLDIIFVADQKIVKIENNLWPEDNPTINYSSDVPVNYVLEVNGGLTERYGISVGDEVMVNVQKK